jgi:hypothetical protein
VAKGRPPRFFTNRDSIVTLTTENDIDGENYEDENEALAPNGKRKKKVINKKLVYLSQKVLEKVQEKPITTGTKVHKKF